MRKIDRLIREAKDYCAWREHKMKRFTHLGRHAYSDCKICGASVAVTPHPLPNEIEIGGEAVALNCNGKG
jgi:hypothetical protein